MERWLAQGPPPERTLWKPARLRALPARRVQHRCGWSDAVKHTKAPGEPRRPGSTRLRARGRGCAGEGFGWPGSAGSECRGLSTYRWWCTGGLDAPSRPCPFFRLQFWQSPKCSPAVLLQHCASPSSIPQTPRELPERAWLQLSGAPVQPQALRPEPAARSVSSPHLPLAVPTTDSAAAVQPDPPPPPPPPSCRHGVGRPHRV